MGRPELLKEHGIDVLHALPGVGENYQDHYICRLVWRMKQPITLNERTRGLALLGEVVKYALLRRGALTYTAGIVCGFVRTRPQLEAPDVQYHIAHASFEDSKRRILDREPGLTLGPCQLRPESRGSIHIKSADPFAAPAIRTNFLAEAADRATLIAGMHLARRLMAATPMDRYRDREVRPGPACRTDDELFDYARLTGATIYHPVGTCRMGHDPMAVVDDRLRVHGVDGLRVIDASIMPTLTGGNTNAPTTMIAEKGADLVKADAAP